MPAPQVGDVVDGYEFKGGDPGNEGSWAFWGDGASSLPDGSIVRYGPRGGMTVLRGATKTANGAPVDAKEFQANNAFRAVLMDQGQTNYEEAVKEGYNPGSLQNTVARAVEDAPWLYGGDYLSDVIRDNPSEKARAAELQFADGALRATTGANAPDKEVVRADKQFFVQPGESGAARANKEELRRRFRDTAVRSAGLVYVPPTPKNALKPDAIKVPKPATDAYRKRREAGLIDRKQPTGTKAHPYVAPTMEIADKLPKGSYVILPDGSFGVVE